MSCPEHAQRWPPHKCVGLYGNLRGFVWKSAWDTPKGQVHCSEEPKWWWELRGFDKLLGALIGFVGRVYNPCFYVPGNYQDYISLQKPAYNYIAMLWNSYFL